MIAARACTRTSVSVVFRSYRVRHISVHHLHSASIVGKLHRLSFCDNVPKVFGRHHACESFMGYMHFHLGCHLKYGEKMSETDPNTTMEGSGTTKLKRKKLKGKRAVVRWLKFFRYKKKRDYQRMTAEEKLLYKLNKARKKEERLVAGLNKIEPKETSETTHDPEILTPEEHFYFLKMGLKSKNYVPVGRRGIYQGVILNMHLHWKKHQTLKVIVKTFSPEEVKEIAVELARLSGGIVLDIHEENEIIMYRGKNYSQPPTEIMSPRITLSRKKALDKSKYRDALRALRRYIPRVEQELELLRAHLRKNDDIEKSGKVDSLDFENAAVTLGLNGSTRLKELLGGDNEERLGSDDHQTDPDGGLESDSEDLSDIFESDLDEESEEDEDDETTERPLYLEQFDKFPSLNNDKGEDFEQQLKWMSTDLKRAEDASSAGKDKDEVTAAELDEIDQIFLRADMLLKRKRK